MDSTPLLRDDTPADPPPLPHISPSAAPVDEDAKNSQEPGVSGPSLNGESKKRAEVLSPGKKEERRAWFSRLKLPPFVGGRAATDAGEGTSGGTSATQEDGKRDRKIISLVGRAEHFAGVWSRHVSLADPSANLAAGLRNFAAAANRETASSLHLAAATMYSVVFRGKLEEETARIVKGLSTEAMALVWAADGGRVADPSSELAASTSSVSTSRSPEVLFYIAIPGSVGLLPYLNTIIPKNLQAFVAILFGTVFSGATVGALLVARARDKADLETAMIVGAITFMAFSFLVIVFVSFALVGGNLVLICVLTVILAAIHTCVWARK
jgi:hypothetical protein